MLSKTMIALSAAIVLGTASTAFALEGRDSDNNPVPGGRGFVQQRAPVFVGGPIFAGPRVFAGPRFAVRHDVRRFAAGSNWDHCARLAHTCVH